MELLESMPKGLINIATTQNSPSLGPASSPAPPPSPSEEEEPAKTSSSSSKKKDTKQRKTTSKKDDKENPAPVTPKPGRFRNPHNYLHENDAPNNEVLAILEDLQKQQKVVESPQALKERQKLIAAGRNETEDVPLKLQALPLNQFVPKAGAQNTVDFQLSPHQHQLLARFFPNHTLNFQAISASSSASSSSSSSSMAAALASTSSPSIDSGSSAAAVAEDKEEVLLCPNAACKRPMVRLPSGCYECSTCAS